jgi:hypothetical protein
VLSGKTQTPFLPQELAMFIDGLVGYLLFAPHSWLEILLGFWALYMIVQWGKRLLSP